MFRNHTAAEIVELIAAEDSLGELDFRGKLVVYTLCLLVSLGMWALLIWGIILLVSKLRSL